MLPVDAILPDLLAALEARTEAVLAAPPGAGKTTRVPPALLAAPWASGGKIVLLSPRRIAARAAARRMAFERGEDVGETIGYRVRLDSKIGPKTRVEVVTEGVFTRMILADPELKSVAAVIFDEFHERSLEGDLGLALARDAQGALRPDLRLIVMSATLDTARIAALLGDAPVIASEGRMFPVATHYRPRDPRAFLEKEVAAAVRAAMASEGGSALVFLPGAREIERTAELLRAEVREDVDVRPLYGAMSGAEQDAAIAPAPAGRRKVVLATSIAETSLTIDGVRIVIDSGLARRPRYEPDIGFTRLETVRASQAAITQRRGRAGRIESGACWRLWSEGETRALPEFDRPEILDADLSGLVLDLASWGVRDPAALAWLDPPPRPAWNGAVTLLKRYGALEDVGAYHEMSALTAHGLKLAELPLPPPLAHMVVAASRNGEGLLAAQIAVLLTEQGLGGRDIDLRARLDGLARDRSPRAKAARALAERIARRAGERGDAVSTDRAGAVLALAYPDRVAKLRSARQPGVRRVSFALANARAAGMNDDEPLAREEYIVVADAAGVAAKAQILSAAPIGLAEIETMLADWIVETTQVEIVYETGEPRARRVRHLNSLVLSETPVEKLSGAELERVLLAEVEAQGLDLLDWDGAPAQAQARVALMRRFEPDVWPDWSDTVLLDTIDVWLAPALSGISRLRQVDVARALMGTLPYELRRRLDAEAPEKFETAAGSSLTIDYAAEGGPAVDVRLQELFGVDKHPSVAGGRAPLTLRLLSPAQRPVQTTKDLPGFWRGSYAAVRAEMRGRYPKHPWPDDPLTALPTRRAKPRS